MSGTSSEEPRPAPAAGQGAYAVIFTSLRTEGDHEYAQTSDEMMALAARQPGYLGVESARGPDGLGITVSYWRDLGAIRAWKAHADHLAAQRAGRERWYRAYRVRVCRVEREYGFP
jgi:heme-degrading monooxygenase HmoA